MVECCKIICYGFISTFWNFEDKRAHKKWLNSGNTWHYQVLKITPLYCVLVRNPIWSPHPAAEHV
jgi:hypothetical protein